MKLPNAGPQVGSMGLDSLGPSIERYLQDTEAVEAALAEHRADKLCLETAQDAVWNNYCETVLEPRETTWSKVAGVISDTPPQHLLYEGTAFRDIWYFQTIRDGGASSKVLLSTVINSYTPGYKLPYELGQLAMYFKSIGTYSGNPTDLLGTNEGC